MAALDTNVVIRLIVGGVAYVLNPVQFSFCFIQCKATGGASSGPKQTW